MSDPIAGNGANLSISRQSPVADYTSADFDSINADLTSYAQATFADRWTDFNEDQFAVVMKELIAYVGDLTSYMINSVIREAFAATVIRRQNLQNIGKTFDYQLLGAIPSTVSLVLTLDPAGTYPTTIERTDQYSNGASGNNQVIFHPTIDIVVASYPVGGLLTIAATQGEYFENVLIGVSNSAPNQRWQFPQQGIYAPSVTIVVGAQTWTPTKNFTVNQSTDLVFKLVQDDQNNTYAIFGDGVFGAVPANAAAIYATFNVGGGRLGNLSANTIQTKVSANSVILSLNNPAPSTGGDDPQTMKSGRNGIPASLSTLERGVTTDDYAKLALLVPGVAKAESAAGAPVGARIIRIWIAPNGGGAPTPVLLTTVSNALQPAKMVTNRIQLFPPFPLNIFFNVLLHVNSAYRAADVESITRQGIINTDGTGLLDFAQLDFAGIATNANGDKELLLTQTLLQGYFNSLGTAGLDRAEIQQLMPEAVGRAPDTGNTGNGTVVGPGGVGTIIYLSSRQRRRQYYVLLLSSAQYAVYERLTGIVTGISDTVLIDANEIFENEGIANFAGYLLIPNADAPASVPVVSATGSNITVNTATSLFTLSSVGDQYYLYNPTPSIWTIGGAPFVSSDGNVSFELLVGTSPFVGNDSFTVDVYPQVSDIRMAKDEYPVLIDSNFITRTSGGSPV